MARSPDAYREPFSRFSDRPLVPDTPLREAITAAYRRAETECVPPLIEAAAVTAQQAAAIRATAETAVKAIRARGTSIGIEALMREYALSSQEGVALMCLAEALMRTPDTPTRDLLIADKIAPGDWQRHLGLDRSLFVNAASWGLAVTGKLVSPVDDTGLSRALTRLVARSGEPVIRAGVNMAMRLLGEHFVAGETISAALRTARSGEAKGFSYSFDMLGEAATTAEDAARYLEQYRTAIHAIGAAAHRKGPLRGPGISIKLSALHPRYCRAQYGRVMGELLSRLKGLATLAKSYDIGLNIDAEEMDRLDLSLDLLEALALDPDLAGWDGLGFVVQAYCKRCSAVIDWIIDLARRSGHRLMVRLVKGAYWDTEIKRAQVDGLDDFPVFTRKVHTDVSYIAAAKQLLTARDAVFPQFATHNAQTMATIHTLAGPDFAPGDYEFQCLYGMGEPLYEQVVPEHKLNRPCRIYAPVGSHATLLAYLVRRLLENGANSSFVNQIADETIPIAQLIADPVAVARQISPLGAPHPQIALPRDILAENRRNSRGLDLSNEQVIRALHHGLSASLAQRWEAKGEFIRTVVDPADHRDIVGTVIEPGIEAVSPVMARAQNAASGWASTLPIERAACLDRAADLMEARMAGLMAMAMREAGKTAANAVSEVREAVDFLRYYAQQARDSFDNHTHVPLGPVVAISPWNFPLAIFTGQVAAALVAGNPVIAKPAEEAPLIAAMAVDIFLEAGVPDDVLHLVIGDGRIGAALVAHTDVCGVLFTGSTDVARLIARQLAGRLSSSGRPPPLIAETGGQNAMIVDSSALTEQVVLDVVASAFDSAGQRCSALRLLCLQDEVADHTLAMLKGAMAQLTIGNPDRLAVDIGPVITTEARDAILAHIEAMRQKGHAISQVDLPPEAAHGTFVPPTLIELDDIAELGAEVFGPVLHVIRFRRQDLGGLIGRINALGYGLTFGLHTRIDSTMAEVTAQILAGNIYINRNQIGAVVGVQPFGGHGLSGTGPKAGGPLYLRRLVTTTSQTIPDLPPREPDQTVHTLADWLRHKGAEPLAGQVLAYGNHSAIAASIELSGPVGERNLYTTRPKGDVLLIASTLTGLCHGLAAGLAAQNRMSVSLSGEALDAWPHLPAPFREAAVLLSGPIPNTVRAVMIEGDEATIAAVSRAMADRDGPIVTVQGLSAGDLHNGTAVFAIDLLVDEVSSSINTAAAGGNASLMTLV